jgi:hypothetical protein
MTSLQPLARPARLPLSHKARLTAEVLSTYARVRRLVRRHDLPTTLAALRRPRAGSEETPVGDEALAAGARLARAVDATLPRLPVDASCLLRSLVLSGLLARREIPARLVIGVEQPGEEFGAHAWVEVAGRPLLDPGAGRFSRLVDL